MGKVVNVGAPRYNNNTQNHPASFTQMNIIPPMVVDVTVETNGMTNTYALTENLSADAIGSTLISTDKADIIRELKATESDYEEDLSNVPKKEEKLKLCKELISELDTEYREKQQTETRLSNLENKFDKIIELLNKKQ